MADTLTADTEPGLPPMVAGAQATSTGAKHELEQRERPRARPQERRRRPAPSRPPAFIDCDLHNELDSTRDLYPYLSRRWRDHLDTYGASGPNAGWYPRFLDHREESRPPSGRIAGSELVFTRTDFIEPNNVAYGILNPLGPAASQLNHELGAALATATNDWQVAEWLDPEPRLRASIAVASEDPVRAAAEIRRCAADKRFVQVLFKGRNQEPMGRRKYWPIYEACAEHGIHVASHAFGQYGFPITGAGHASYYIEDHTSPSQAVQANVTSLVMEGVFDRFGIKFVSVENAFGWVPSLMWRLDAAWKLLGSEIPHLQRPPSEVIAEHVYVATQPVEEPPRMSDYAALMEQFGPMTDNLLLASDYPHWDADDPGVTLPHILPEELKHKIRFANAARLYGLAHGSESVHTMSTTDFLREGS